MSNNYPENQHLFDKAKVNQSHDRPAETPSIDRAHANHLQKCFYVISLLKEKDYDLWENFHAQYVNTKPEESWELFQMVVEEYCKLSEKKKVRKLVARKAKPAARKKAA